MKFSAAILLQIMLVLTTLPIASKLFTVKENTCMMGCGKMCASKQKPDNKTTGSNDVCNPFLSCSFCIFITTEKMVLTDLFFEQNNKFNRLKNVNILSSYHAECWHPPEIN